jgi:hypothetical protein
MFFVFLRCKYNDFSFIGIDFQHVAVLPRYNFDETVFILVLVSARDSYIKPDSEAGGLIWVEGWYQGRYGKFHVIIYLSHILHWLYSSIDFYMAEKIFELTNCENESLRELPFFNLQIFLFRVLNNDVRKCLYNLPKTLSFEWKFLFMTTYIFELIIPIQVI